MSSRSAALIAVNLAALLFGCSALFGKLSYSPFLIVCARSGFACVGLYLVQLLKKDSFQQSAKLQLRLFQSGFMLAAHWLLFFAAVQLGSIALATVTFATFPLFTIVFGSLYKRQLPSFLEFFAALIVLSAIIILSLDKFVLDPSAISALGCGLLSALFFALFTLLSKELNRKNSRLLVSLFQNLYVFFLLLPASLLTDTFPQETSTWLSLAALGIFVTAGAHQLYFYALQYLEANTCAVFLCMEPVYAIFLAKSIYEENIGMTVLLCGVAIFLASAALLRHESKH